MKTLLASLILVAICGCANQYAPLDPLPSTQYYFDSWARWQAFGMTFNTVKQYGWMHSEAGWTVLELPDSVDAGDTLVLTSYGTTDQPTIQSDCLVKWGPWRSGGDKFLSGRSLEKSLRRRCHLRR